MKCKGKSHRSALVIGAVGADEARPTRLRHFGMFGQIVIASIAVLAVTHWAVAQPVDLDEPTVIGDCDQGDDASGVCFSGCDPCADHCDRTWAQIKADKQLQEADNLGCEAEKYDLIIYQQTGLKGEADWFQWYAWKWLHQVDKAPDATHWAVNTIAEALAAIKATFAADGNAPINVIIVGHGTAGLIKVGHERLDKGNITDLANVRWMIKRLVLFGCSVSDDGKNFVSQLGAYIGAPVKSWTGPVWASTKGLYHEGEKNVVVPAASEWGMIVITLLLLTAITVVFGRRRRAAAA